MKKLIRWLIALSKEIEKKFSIIFLYLFIKARISIIDYEAQSLSFDNSFHCALELGSQQQPGNMAKNCQEQKAY